MSMPQQTNQNGQQQFPDALTSGQQQPQSQPKISSSTNTFVHKLYNMVLDKQYQHLIAWNYTGTTFIICNIVEFSRDVLPKHFKHNNFSSFVRQLNMYGFHKVNKSPRGHRTMAENQIWEFSHPKFIQNRADLLDEIKRKAMEVDVTRKDTRDLHGHMTMMQASHSEMLQRIGHLSENFNELVKELRETKQRMCQQDDTMRSMMNYIAQQNGGQLPTQFHHVLKATNESQPPSIFITSPDPTSHASDMHGHGTPVMHDVYGSSPVSPIQTQHLDRSSPQPLFIPHNHTTLSPMSLGTFGTSFPTSPSASSMISDEDLSFYSPHSPHSPHSPISHSPALNSPFHLDYPPASPRPSTSPDMNSHHQSHFNFPDSFNTLNHH